MAPPYDFNRLSRLIGAKIRLQSEEGEYIGVVASASSKAAKVVLEKVKCFNEESGKEVALSGLLSFSLDEILSYECLDLPELPPPPPQVKTKQSRVPPLKPPPAAPIKPPQDHSKAPLVRPTVSRTYVSAPLPNGSESAENAKKNENLESLWDQCYSFKNQEQEIPGKLRPNHYVVVDFIGDNFYEAIALIQNQSVIGCGFDGISLGRNGQLDWIEVATKELIVLFDMLSMHPQEAFNAGLRDIFQSESIIKVVHDCRQISDLLFHQFEIFIVNAHDTQVADVMVQRMLRYGRIPRYVRNLAICLKDYLALTTEQTAFYEVRKLSIERDNEVWHKRPLPPFLLEAAALNVRYLRELRSATLDKMLEEYTLGVDIFLSAVRDDSQYSNSIDHHGELLPQDFYQLDYPTMVRLKNTDMLNASLNNGSEIDASRGLLSARRNAQPYSPQVRFSEVPKTKNDDLHDQKIQETTIPALDREINKHNVKSTENYNFDDMPGLEEIESNLSEDEEEELGLSVGRSEKPVRAGKMTNAIVQSTSSRQSYSVSLYEKLSREIEKSLTPKNSTDLAKSEQGLSQIERCSRQKSLDGHESDLSDYSLNSATDFRNKVMSAERNRKDLIPNGTVLAAPKLQPLSNGDARFSGLRSRGSGRPRLNIPPAGMLRS